MGYQTEKRHLVRAIELPVEFSAQGSGQRVPGIARDISIGGMFIETKSPAAFGSAVRIGFPIPGRGDPLLLEATVRWTGASGMGVQFGLLGARETHAITEVARARSVREPTAADQKR
jgi:type IV pilus assembly protein PilZ